MQCISPIELKNKTDSICFHRFTSPFSQANIFKLYFLCFVFIFFVFLVSHTNSNFTRKKYLMHIFPFACIRFIFAVKRQSQISKWIVHYTYESIVQCMGIKFFFFIFLFTSFLTCFYCLFSIGKNCWITFISFFLIYVSEGDTIAYNYVVAFSEKIVFLFFCFLLCLDCTTFYFNVCIAYLHQKV